MSLCSLLADNADVSRQMEEAESRASQLSRSKALLQSQLEDLKKQLDEEAKVNKMSRMQMHLKKSLALQLKVQYSHVSPVCPQCKQAVSSSLSSLRQECEVLKEQLEEEQESKQELQRLVSKLNSEVTHWRTKHESDSIQHADDLEDTKYVVLILAIIRMAFNWSQKTCIKTRSMHVIQAHRTAQYL